MAENGLSERVERIEQKLDKQFTDVQEHFAEQRKYIEFAYDKLDKRIDGLDTRMNEGLASLDQRIDRLDRRMTDGFSGLDQRIGRLDQRIDRMDQRIDRMDKRMTDGFSRLERKFDQFIDTPPRPMSAARHRASPSKRRR
jgi:flagellar capping protein FliD